MATTNTTGDDATLAALQATLQSDTAILNGDPNSVPPIIGLLAKQTAAQTNLTNAQNALQALQSDSGLVGLNALRQGLASAGKYGVKDKNGNFFWITAGGQIWSGADSNAEYLRVAPVLTAWDNNKTAAQNAVNDATTQLATFTDPQNGSVAAANAQIAADLKAITDFVPTTNQGQSVITQLASNQAQVSQSGATQAQASATQADAQQNIASSDTQTYMIIAAVIIAVIVGVLFFIKEEKKAA